ncbi:hypothetical protein BTHI11S_03279 [Bosea thiooxidans]
MTTPILELDGVVGGYGAMTILNGTSFAGEARRNHRTPLD